MNHGQSEPPSGAHAPGEDPDGDLRDVQGALVWEADPWAIHLSLRLGSTTPMLTSAGDDLVAEAGGLKKYVHPDDWCSLLDTMYQAAAEGGVHTCQHRFVRPDGVTRWAQTTVQRGPRSNGSLMLTGVSVDTTKLMERERARRDAEGHARVLVENLRQHAVYMLTADGRIASWNPGSEQLHGYTDDDILGTPFSGLFPGEEVDKGGPDRLLHTAALERHTEYEGWLVKKGDTRFWAILTLSAVVDEHGRLLGFTNIAKDMSLRRQAEQALRRSEAHFRLLVESIQNYAVFTLSQKGRVETWNRGAQRLKGFRAHEVIGSPMSRFFLLDEDRAGTPERLIRDAELKGSATYEGLLVRKDGTPFWAHVTLCAVEDEQGRLRGFSYVARDRTEHKRNEDTLREREERLRLLIDSLQDHGVFLLTPTGHVATWSPGAERIKGYKAEDIIGAPLSRFFPPEEIENGTAERLIEGAKVEGRAEYEGWIVRASGARLWVSISLSAVRDAEGRLRGFSDIVKDLTQRMRAERAQAFLAEVGTVLARSLDYRTTYDAICRVAIGELAHWCVLFMCANSSADPVSVAHIDAEQEDRLRSAVKPMPATRRRDHGVGNVLLTGQPELAADVSEASWVGDALGIEDGDALRELQANSYICVPLTARGTTFGAVVLVAHPGHRYTREDVRTAEEFAHRAALAADNARLFEEARTAIRLRQEVLEVVTHDLRNPLNTIHMGAAHLARELPDPGSTGAKIVDAIRRASDRMTKMIDDLLDFSSIETGRLRLDLAEHDGVRLVNEAVDAMQPIAANEGIRITTHHETARLGIRCDRDRLLQVFSNLLGNAVRFTEEDGAVVVRSRVEDHRAVFIVSDMGPGIAESDLPHVFDRYWRSERKSRESLGLGLAISKGIVQSHGGSIWVESTLGEGTTFYVSLPIDGQAPMP